MKTTTAFVLAVSVSVTTIAQGISSKLQSAFNQFEQDGQLQSGIASLYVVDAKTGKPVFDKNSKIGLAPASTQKVITAATAYAMLGKDFRYQTKFGYTANGNTTTINIQPSGDPTLGSWRWPYNNEEAVMKRLAAAAKPLGGKTVDKVIVDAKGWNSESIPDGWIWQDIGNYYGAGAGGLNWRENQFDLHLQSGSSIGDEVKVTGTKPQLYGVELNSQAKAAAKGTGDNAYIYYPLQTNQLLVRGTIPAGESKFVISGAMPQPQQQFTYTLLATLKGTGDVSATANPEFNFASNNTGATVFHTEYSPMLDSIVYWFNKKSINLYGEALVKTIAMQSKGEGETGEGIKVLKAFWKEQGVAATELNMVDGSGLSPLNRVTTKAQVEVLQYAKKQSWYAGFYNSLPEYNGMKMKSGTIRGVKGFTGYHKSKDGNEYIFSFIVNNYNGSSSSLVQKMYKVLDVLK
ncbi:MAG: D-alanyl-D-alanine carboxypeptidase/D-alanyl-D-alanine endopeptidase [Chitinophagaceae bacterium]